MFYNCYLTRFAPVVRHDGVPASVPYYLPRAVSVTGGTQQGARAASTAGTGASYFAATDPRPSMDETTRGNWAVVSAGVGVALLALPFLVGDLPTLGLFLSFLAGALLLVTAALLASDEFPPEPLVRGGQ